MDRSSTAALWLADGVHRRTALQFFFNVWYLSDSPAARIVQANESASMPTLPRMLGPDLLCLGTARQLRDSERRARAASRLAELLSTWRVERIRLIKKVVIAWHGIVLWNQHLRETVVLSRTAPEPEGEPEARHRTGLQHMFRDLRALYCLVRFLCHADVRTARCTSSFALFELSTAQARPNFTLVDGRPALIWHRGIELPVIICIARPQPGDENHPRALVDFLD